MKNLHYVDFSSGLAHEDADKRRGTPKRTGSAAIALLRQNRM